MPLYRYLCPQCNAQLQKLSKVTQSKLPCECGAELLRQLPSDLNTQTLEMRDPHRGVQLPKNQEKRVKERFTNHHNKNETAAKIDEHGMDDAQRNGWLKTIKKN